jgi:hypothetical protein
MAEGLAGVLRYALRGPSPRRPLKRIRYGNKDSGDSSTGYLEVVFDYGEHDPDAPTPA